MYDGDILFKTHRSFAPSITRKQDINRTLLFYEEIKPHNTDASVCVYLQRQVMLKSVTYYFLGNRVRVYFFFAGVRGGCQCCGKWWRVLLCGFSSLHRNVQTSSVDSSCCFPTLFLTIIISGDWCSERRASGPFLPPININTAVCARHGIITVAEDGCNEVLRPLRQLPSHSVPFLSESAAC